MKLKYLITFISLISLTFPIYSENIVLDLQQQKKEIKEIINASTPTAIVAKLAMFEALDRVNKSKEIKDPEAITDFGRLMKNKMKFLPPNERLPFLKQLRTGITDETLRTKVDWYFITEEALSKPNFTEKTVIKSAASHVAKLNKALFLGESQELENITRLLKQDITKLVFQGNPELLETFIKTYSSQAAQYCQMERSLNLFLSELMNHNLPLNLIKNTTVPMESLVRNTIPALMKNFSWNSFITEHQGIILQDILQSNKKFSFFNFTNMVSNAYLDKKLSQVERELQAKISILTEMANIADPLYQKFKPLASNGYIGERSILRGVSLGENFGKLPPKNAKELAKIIYSVPIEEIKPVLPNASRWIEGFSRWILKSFNGKNIILTTASMIALVEAEELIKFYTNYNPSNAYLNIMDEITDALAIGNNIKLVYNTVYDGNFAKYFLSYVEEGNLTKEEELAYMETFDNFESAMYASFFQTAEDNIAGKDWQCFVLNENCPNKA